MVPIIFIDCDRILHFFLYRISDWLDIILNGTFLADAFLSAGANEVYLPLHTLPKITRFDGIRPIIELKLRNKDLDLQAFHPLGTCRMGADPRESVIDPFGRLYGLDNLFVADGSIFPTSLGVNPMITIMAAAHKIAGNIHREFL